MDDVGKLLVFRDVVELESFTEAARRRGLSHSTVSKHIKSLEEQLGTRLLHRTSRSMSLTESGRMVYEYSRRIGADIEEMTRRLEASSGRVRGELRVTSLLHVGRHLVQPALASYLAEYPEVRATLVLDDGPLHFQRDGFDIAVRVGLEVEASLTARKLLDNEVCLAAAPGLLERRGAPEHPARLAEFPAVAYASRDVEITSWAYLDDGEICSVRVDPVLRVDDGNALLEAVRAGLGVGYLSAFAARADLARGSLVRVCPDFELPPYDPVYLLHSGSEHRAPKVRAFERHLEARAEELRA